MKGTIWCEVVLGVLVIVFALLNWQYAILVLGIILILHAFMCQKCKMCNVDDMPVKRGKRR